MKLLDEELTLRGIPRPVVCCSDNHASRKDEALLKFCKDHGIRLFFELANTSGFLQALDQCNKKYHEAYNKAIKRYKENLNDQGITSPSLTLSDFLQINAEIWSTWWTPLDRRNAFRRVGILQRGLDSDQVDRSKFYFPPPPPLDEPPVPTTAESPLDVKKGGTAYWKKKFESQCAITQNLMEIEVGPEQAGILVPDRVQRKKDPTKNRKITDGHGSATLSKLLEKRVAQRTANEAEVLRKANAAQERAEKKAAKSAATLLQLEKWRACQGGCVCANFTCCVYESLVLCPFCDTLKSRVCRVKSCLEKQAALEVECGSDSD